MKFSGVTILQGFELSIFLLIFEWALQQCSATALPVILFVAELTSLEYRRDQLSRSFFQDITHPSSSLYHLLPPPHDTSVLSPLITATWFARPVSRTKKYCSFINYALIHYQVPPITASGLDPSLHFVGLLCCVHVLKLFLISSSCSAFGPQECQ